ncbi:MAG: response regulator, partial [Acidobacteria bacterium]|nr:response regulator [Acidobacteriota bacterium]
GELLRAEARDCLEQMHRTLNDLAREPERRELLEDVRRPAHTLKGSAATAGFKEVGVLAHRFEDLLEIEAFRIGSLDAERLRLFLEVADGLEDLLTMDRNAGRTPETEALLERIQAAQRPPLGGGSGGTPALAVEVFDRPGRAAAPSVPPSGGPPATQVPPQTAPGVAREADPVEAERFLRIPASSVEEVLRVAGESLVHRASFEGHFASLREVEDELTASLARLERLSRRLQTEYEARALMETPASRARGIGVSEFDVLEMDRYTEIHLIGRELAETVADVGAVASTLSQTVGGLGGFHGRLGRLLGEVEERLGRLRMVPFASLQGRLFRTVRAAEREARVKADLSVEAAGVEVDKNVLDELAEPLLHVLRNAVDHGIEPPAERRAAGKSERGAIRITASYQGAQIEVEIEDDGRGLDLEALRAKAVERGLLTREQGEALSDHETAQLAFLPRVSTAGEVSQLSGRGVGLEVMRTVVDRLRGSLVLESTPGKGTRLTLRLPMTLASVRALFVRARGEVFALPQTAVQQILRVAKEDLVTGDGGPVLPLGGEGVPVLDLGAHLSLPAVEEAPWPRPALVVQADGERRVVLVDALGGSREAVVKTLGPLLRNLRRFIGATLTGDGKVILLLDPTALLRGEGTRPALLTEAAQAPSEAIRVLVVDDSLTVRRILTRLIEARGWQAASARDGLEALEMLQGGLDPSAVLLDIEMPRMDGYELTALLRADPSLASVPIVMLTSRAGQKHRDKAADLGVDAYLVKPYDEETLVRTVREVARIRGAATTGGGSHG